MLTGTGLSPELWGLRVGQCPEVKMSPVGTIGVPEPSLFLEKALFRSFLWGEGKVPSLGFTKSPLLASAG